MPKAFVQLKVAGNRPHISVLGTCSSFAAANAMAVRSISVSGMFTSTLQVKKAQSKGTTAQTAQIVLTRCRVAG